jgi:hypothetical protein
MPEFKVHSFIVKLWFEDETQRKGMGGWHGHITHVPSGDRHHLKELEDIVRFIRPYIGELDRTVTSKIRRWLKSGM